MNKHTVIGLMSGSSLDGLDIVCVRFWARDNVLKWDLSAQPITVRFPENIYTLLKQVHQLDEEALGQLDFTLGSFYGDAVAEYVAKHNLKVDLVASHGHTVRHKPEEGFSLQIGDGKTMAARCKIPCVNQFRSVDIQYGGQGAPLAPVVEHYLFGAYQAFINLGGISNISLHKKEQIIAYDVCPVNQLLNHLANKMGLEYDDKGTVASQGMVDDDLLAALWDDPYHVLTYPKSLDNNYIRENFVRKLDESSVSVQDKLATCTKYIAACLGKEINRLSTQTHIEEILLTGGGAYNEYLLALLQLEIGDTQLVLPKDEIIQHKESVLMALCGYLFLNKKANSFAAATGASEDTINGVLFQA